MIFWCPMPEEPPLLFAASQTLTHLLSLHCPVPPSLQSSEFFGAVRILQKPQNWLTG